MIDYPGACGLPEIDADVKAFGTHGLLQDFDRLIQEVEYLPFFFRQEVFHLTDVSEWYDHEMAAVIGITIHHDECRLPLIENKVMASGRVLAENTACLLFTFNEFHSPGRVYFFHL
jgi:hypothetical protein